MKHYLDTLVSQLQNQLRQVDADAAAWKMQNEEKLNQTIESESRGSLQQIKNLKVQLAELESKRSTIKKYYTAYYDEASLSVQKSTSCQPVPVNMNLFKNQLVNPNHKQAADTIVTMARSNLEYLRQQEEELKEQIDALEAAAKQAKEELSMLDTQLKMKYEKQYLEVLISADMMRINDQCAMAAGDFQEDGWESFFYEDPQCRREELMIGTSAREMKLPEYMHIHAGMNPNWKDNRLHVPVMVPLEGFHMLVSYHVSQSMITREGIRTLIGNLLKFMPAGSVRVYPFDLETFNGVSFGGLTRLAGSEPAFLAPVPGSEDQVLKELKEIYDDAVKVSKKITGYRSLEEYNSMAMDSEKLRQKVLILYGCPERLSSKALEYLERIYYMSAQCGISIIAIHNAQSDINVTAAKTFYQNMRSDALVIESTAEGQFLVCGSEKAPFRWQRGLHTLSDETVEAVCEAYGANAVGTADSDNEKIEDQFKKIHHTRGNRRLNLAFGVDEENRVKRFSFEEMNFAAYISGSAGCGKSSLMHTLIAGILLNYHPEDVELWLVDFKMTEFQLYAKHMPPHVKRVVLESSEEVVLDLIDELTDILEKRTRLFSKYGLKDIIKLPEAFRMKHLPLIIVMVDEFATMTQIIRNAPQFGSLTYAEKLENLLAKGRALGFRFIFADQAYESGVYGLTTKAKNQIGQRFAMANVSQEEMKGTLALPSGAVTEEVKKWMATMPPYHTLTSEKEAVEGTLEHIVQVHRSKVAFVPQERMIEIISQLNAMYTPVASSKELTDDTYIDKKPLVVDGQRVYTFRESEEGILNWEKNQNYPQEIMRLYLGRPCALRKQSPVELKPAPGENLLLLVETPDLAASEVLSAVESVSSGKISTFRDPLQVTVLADRLDPLYLRYKNFWKKQNCLTDMADICEKISQLRQKAEKNKTENELVVIFGIYSLYQQWEELPKKKAAAGVTGGDSAGFDSDRDLDFEMPDLYSVKPVKMTAEPSPLVSMLGDAILDDSEEDDLEDLDALFEDDPLFADHAGDNGAGAENFAGDGEKVYNAIEDFRWLLTKGPAKGIHFLAVLSQYSEYREMKWSDKMFRHLVYQWLAKDELSDIIGYGRSARIPNGALRYVSKKDAFSLRPYLWPGLTINGWIMDTDGNAVEAGDEDDEFI